MSAAAADPTQPLYSVVIPVYRSATILPETVKRLDAFFAEHPFRHEYVFVNDGSPDHSWRVLCELKGDRSDMTIIDLMRNFGQHSAMLCGLDHASGDFVITMDDDLQNPPEEIAKLIEKANEGADVVFGRFQQKMHGRARRVGSKFIGWLNAKFFEKPADLTLTNFRIIRREIVDAVCQVRTSAPYLPGLLLMTGRSFANVDVEHSPRFEGESNYTPRVIARLTWRIIFNYSALPLRVLSGLGAVTALLALLLGGFYLVRGLFLGSRVPGWTTLVVLLSFYHGVTLVILGAVGEYLVRVMNDVSGRGAYLIRTKL